MEFFDVFFEKFFDITQEPIEQGCKKNFSTCPKNYFDEKIRVFGKTLYRIFQAPSEFFLAVLKENFSQDCQNCILRVQIDILRFFDKEKWNLSYHSGKGTKSFVIMAKKLQICHNYVSRGNFWGKKRFFNRNVSEFFRSLSGITFDLGKDCSSSFFQNSLLRVKCKNLKKTVSGSMSSPFSFKPGLWAGNYWISAKRFPQESHNCIVKT